MLGMREREGQRSECLSAAGWDREAEDARRSSRGHSARLANLGADAVSLGRGRARFERVEALFEPRREIANRGRLPAKRGLTGAIKRFGVEEVGGAQRGKEHPREHLAAALGIVGGAEKMRG